MVGVFLYRFYTRVTGVTQMKWERKTDGEQVSMM
jgi:hypothetical protein